MRKSNPDIKIIVSILVVFFLFFPVSCAAKKSAGAVKISSADLIINDNILVQYTGAAEAIIVPDNLGIKIIGEKSFYKTSIKSIKIPEGVTEISYDAFTLCSKLENIELPSTLEAIRSNQRGRQMGTFYGCLLPVIKIPASVSDLGNWNSWPRHTVIEVDEKNKHYVNVDGVLFDKEMTTLLHYPGSLKNESYTIPSTVKIIERFSFNSSENLRTVELPEGLTSIERSAFDGSGIITINLPSTLTSIGSYVFSHCPNLIKLVIPEGVKPIVTTNSFTYCNSLESVELPADTEIIENGAFIGCPSLKRIVLTRNTIIREGAIRSDTGIDVTTNVDFVFY